MRLGMKKYSRGSRGGPAKALGRHCWRAGSNPAFFATNCRCSSMVERDLAKVDTRVRFPSSAPNRKYKNALIKAFFIIMA